MNTNTAEAIQRVKEAFRTIPDFPKKGILFRDVTGVVERVEIFREAVGLMCAPFAKEKIERIAAIEARGFLFGAAMSLQMNCGLALVRKKGKLPCKTIEKSYALEYGSATIEIHADSIRRGERVLVVDDLLATGGTAKAAAELVEASGGVVVGFSFLCELPFFKAKETVLAGYRVETPIAFDGE